MREVWFSDGDGRLPRERVSFRDDLLGASKLITWGDKRTTPTGNVLTHGYCKRCGSVFNRL
jgi:hypothetical protein